MLLLVITVSLLVGFGAGRIKNAGKLSAVKAELAKVETSTVTEVKKLAADIKAKL